MIFVPQCKVINHYQSGQNTGIYQTRNRNIKQNELEKKRKKILCINPVKGDVSDSELNAGGGQFDKKLF